MRSEKFGSGQKYKNKSPPDPPPSATVASSKFETELAAIPRYDRRQQNERSRSTPNMAVILHCSDRPVNIQVYHWVEYCRCGLCLRREDSSSQRNR
jgi:hypothetical protein